MFKFWRRKSVDTPASEVPPAAADAPVPEAAQAAFEPPVSEPAPPKPASWRERLAHSGIARSLGGLFRSNPKLDEALLEELETTLITSDVGVALSTELTERLRKRVNAREFADSDALLAALRAELLALLKPVERPLTWDA